MTRYFLVFAALICYLTTRAQQEPLYSQYMFNMLGINPAYAGNREVLSLTGTHRSQWAGIKGAPVSDIFSGDFAVKKKKIGLGMQVMRDEIGITKTTTLNFSFAYRLRLNNGVFSMGLLSGITSLKGYYSNVLLAGDPADPAFSNNINAWAPNIGAGLFYNTDNFFLGFSVPNLMNKNVLDNGSRIARIQNYYLIAGCSFKATHDITLKPSLLLRTVSGAPLNMDVNMNVWFFNLVAVGISYRTSQMLLGMLQFQVNRQMRFGYTYDWPLSGLRSGSHELLLRYEFGYEKRRVLSPRHF